LHIVDKTQQIDSNQYSTTWQTKWFNSDEFEYDVEAFQSVSSQDKNYFSDILNEGMSCTNDISPQSYEGALNSNLFTYNLELRNQSNFQFEENNIDSSSNFGIDSYFITTEGNNQITDNLAQQQENNWLTPLPVDKKSIPKNIQLNDMVDEIFDTLMQQEGTTPKTYGVDLAVRKDVVNKNLLRTVSRYFKEELSLKFPDFKNALKNPHALEQLLTSFWKSIFGHEQELVPDLKYILGAFVIAPKMKNMDIGISSLSKISQIHKTLSKYSHKDLDEMFKIPHIHLIIQKFTESGYGFFLQSDVVKKHQQVYIEALKAFNCRLTC